MQQIILNVTDEQLEDMVKTLNFFSGVEYKVLKPIKLLELLLKQEVDSAGGFMARCIDEGGNELIGDVLDEEECEGVVVEEES